MSVIAIVLSRGVNSPYSLFSQQNTIGSFNAQAMLAASWKAPMFVAPSPKNATETLPLLLYLSAKAAPTAIGEPAPTMPLAPSIPSSSDEMCIEPPLPLQYPVALPISSAIIGRNCPPLATR